MFFIPQNMITFAFDPQNFVSFLSLFLEMYRFWSCSYLELKIAQKPFEGYASTSIHSAELRTIGARHN